MDPFKLAPLPPDFSFSAGTAALSPRRDTVEIPVFWIVLLLSVLVHVAVLLIVPPLRVIRPGADPTLPLAVELQPPPQVSAAPETAPQPKAKTTPSAPVPPRPAPPPKVAPRAASPRPVAPPPRAAVPAPRPPAPPKRTVRPSPPAPPARITPPPPPVIAKAEPAPEIRPPEVQAEPVAPPRVETPPAGDLASYIEARRRARGESSSTSAAARSGAEPAARLDDDARRNAIVAQNLGLDRAPAFGGAPRPGGGIFQITRLYYSNAEFVFYGWNKDVRRNTSQVIDVRKGEHSDIKLAVIRRMIAIIREYESGDFLWESPRLGRHVTLSARPGDNAGLEDFLMREFFGEPREVGAAGRG